MSSLARTPTIAKPASAAASSCSGSARSSSQHSGDARRASPRALELGAVRTRSASRGSRARPPTTASSTRAGVCFELVLDLDVVVELRAERLEHLGQRRERRAGPAAALPGMRAVEPAARRRRASAPRRGGRGRGPRRGVFASSVPSWKSTGTPIARELHVELDLDHAELERAREGGQRVLGRERRGAAMRDHMKGTGDRSRRLRRRACRGDEPAGSRAGSRAAGSRARSRQRARFRFEKAGSPVTSRTTQGASHSGSVERARPGRAARPPPSRDRGPRRRRSPRPARRRGACSAASRRGSPR